MFLATFYLALGLVLALLFAVRVLEFFLILTSLLKIILRLYVIFHKSANFGWNGAFFLFIEIWLSLAAFKSRRIKYKFRCHFFELGALMLPSSIALVIVLIQILHFRHSQAVHSKLAHVLLQFFPIVLLKLVAMLILLIRLKVHVCALKVLKVD